jgi:hypothetical protein
MKSQELRWDRPRNTCIVALIGVISSQATDGQYVPNNSGSVATSHGRYRKRFKQADLTSNPRLVARLPRQAVQAILDNTARATKTSSRGNTDDYANLERRYPAAGARGQQRALS